jgi:fibro-slime domain-containing protein
MAARTWVRCGGAALLFAGAVFVLGPLACSSKSEGEVSGFDSGTGTGTSGGGDAGKGSGASDSGGGGGIGDGGLMVINGDSGGGSFDGVLTVVIRDFRFYDAGDHTTDPDFEHTPNIRPDGGALDGYNGDWDDPNIITAQLGADSKPEYAYTDGGSSYTTHGKAAFDEWYNDTDGGNLHVEVPLMLTVDDAGAYAYDSNVSGQLYVATDPSQGRGFFPIDDGTAYATAFGNQGKPHNYSFTTELHTSFTYQGGEYFSFRGDDDVFVYIAGKNVINLGGIHSPETAMVAVDSLGLTKGETYPLDFFSAERHVTGSNILFTTTLQLRPVTGIR